MELPRKCPFAGCDKDLLPSMPCCARHWLCLSQAEQSRTREAYRDYLREVITYEEMRRVQREVIDAVKGRT